METITFSSVHEGMAMIFLQSTLVSQLCSFRYKCTVTVRFHESQYISLNSRMGI